MYLVTTNEMQRIEQAADAAGLSYDEMMTNAGTAVTETVADLLDDGVVTVLVGPGNNGGDGLVAAGQLHEIGFDVRVYVWKRAAADDRLAAVSNLPQVRGDEDQDGAKLADWLAESDLAVDALLGTGLSRPVEGTLATVLDRLAAAEVPVLAVDMPTGVDPDDGSADPHAVPADVTVTFAYPKVGQLRFPAAEYVGELITADIGIPPDLGEGELRVPFEADVARSLPERPLDAHKGTFGRTLVVGGSINYSGAVYLAAAAAYRAGSGLVTLALPGSIQRVVAGLLPEATHVVLPEDLGVLTRGAAPVLRREWSAYDAVLLGPGLTTETGAAELMELLVTTEPAPERPIALGFGQGHILRTGEKDRAADGEAATARWPERLVIDADGLNLLASIPDALSGLPAESVLTPHPGEMARLTDRTPDEVNADRVGSARQAAEAWGHIVVLKGAFTVVAAPDGRVSVNPFATPALATAGTGDVLSGLVTGLLAQGMAPFDAAVAAAYLHGLAGELADHDVGSRATMAGDVLAALPEAIWLVEA